MNDDQAHKSACERVLGTAELLEQILICLLEDIFPKTEHEDPRSARTQANAAILLHLVHCSEVNRIWHHCILHGSKPIQRALFLREDHLGSRSWEVGRPWYPTQRDYDQDLIFRIPILNPVLRATLDTYRFRFWKNAAEAWGPRYRAYLIIKRKDAEAAKTRFSTGQGKTLSPYLRPKLGKRGAVTAGKGFQDFVIRREEGFEGWVNLLGIESPGLTSCLAIAERVDGLVYGNLKE